ncbi:MAG: hypothetical protein O2856_01810 [Planctomycetota bacterium]|nr:hypothetical protein [Planctomycetota bacterium]
MRAASPEVTSTGGLGDERQAHLYRQGLKVIADGVDEMRQTVRFLSREGVDTIKINLSGDAFVRPRFGEKCAYSEAEIAVASEEAHDRGCRLSCHARADRAIRFVDVVAKPTGLHSHPITACMRKRVSVLFR